MSAESAKPPFGDGRDQKGRFTNGNSGGPGNPLGGKISKLRSALVLAVSEDDIRAIAEKLIAEAKIGDLGAVRELFLRTLGRPVEADLLERIERVEGMMEERT